MASLIQSQKHTEQAHTQQTSVVSFRSSCHSAFVHEISICGWFEIVYNLSPWFLDVYLGIVQYSKMYSLSAFTYCSCLEQLKCNKAASSDHLGAVNIVVWG